MRSKAGVVGIALAMLLGIGAGRSGAQLSIGSGVNQGCISMRITYSLCGIILFGTWRAIGGIWHG